MGKVANRYGGREAVSRRPPIPLDTIVARTRMYTHAAKVWTGVATLCCSPSALLETETLRRVCHRLRLNKTPSCYLLPLTQ
jgi:hypothetical protein